MNDPAAGKCLQISSLHPLNHFIIRQFLFRKPFNEEYGKFFVLGELQSPRYCEEDDMECHILRIEPSNEIVIEDVKDSSSP